MPGDETTPFVGGAISSPRNLDRRRQAATARVSQFDIAALADAQYHGGSEGYCPLTPALIHRCGYTAINTVDVISSYNKIVLVHESVITNWVGRFTVGPQIDRILEKHEPYPAVVIDRLWNLLQANEAANTFTVFLFEGMPPAPPPVSPCSRCWSSWSSSA